MNMDLKENKLTSEQIDKIFLFVSQRYVDYRDVQCELVDHLASSIEELLEEQPHLTFDIALRKVYGRFPITGFHVFVDKKEEGMRKFWRIKMWDFLKEYLKLPKIVILLFLIYIFKELLFIYQVSFIYTFYFLLTAFVLITKSPDLVNHFKKRKQVKYLVLSSYYKIFDNFLAAIFYMPLYTLNIIIQDFNQMNTSLIFALFIASFFAISILSVHAFLFVFPNMLKEEVETKYAHLQISFA